MALVKWKNRDVYEPWDAFSKLQDEINSLFHWDTYPSTNGLFDRSASPALDVVEEEEAFKMICELPGVDPKDLEVSVASNVLTLKGERKEDNEDKSENFYRKETWSGSFQKTYSLPESVDASQIEAHLENGLLTLVLPKKEEVKPKMITVEAR